MKSISDLRKLPLADLVNEVRGLENADLCELANALFADATGCELLPSVVASHLATRLALGGTYHVHQG